jgi:polysaccharide biosynthesis transport protein
VALMDRTNFVNDLGRVLLKRRWTIGAFFLVVTLVVTVATLLQPDIFSATAVIQIESEAPNIVGFKEVVALGAQNYWASKEYYETQFRIIRSRPVLEKVIEALDLDAIPPFDTMDQDRRPRYLSNILRVAPVKSSQLVNLTVEFTDMKTAVEIANALAKVYQHENFRRKSDAAQSALEWLGEEEVRRTDRVREKEQELHSFLVDHEIVSFEERQNVVAKRVQDLSDALTQVKRKRIGSQVHYQKAAQFRKQGKSLAIPEVIDNKLIQDLKADLIFLQKEISKAAAKWKPDHPGYKKLVGQETELKKRIDEEIGNIILSLQATYSTDLAGEGKLGAELDATTTEALELSRLEIQYRQMEREASSEGLLFDEIQQRQKETEITKSLPDISNNVRVIEQAREPERPEPVRPRRRVNVMLGALLGLMGGIGLAFVLEFLDTTIKSAEDLERSIDAPFLGIIPSFDDDLDAVPDELFTHRFPKSSITESVRSIRTNITFSTAGKELKRLLVTSAGPQEGKSTAVINLGIIFAQGGKRVLIIDSDLRRPRLHRAFKVGRKRGLTNLIMEEASIEEVVIHTEVPGVDLIPCGPIPPNPSELLGTQRMRDLSYELADRYDLVLFDSPPIVAVTDAVVMSKIVDGVVIIAKAGKTTTEIVTKASRRLGDVKATILGSVLNDFNIRGAGYRYYYYYYHYRSREGEEEGGQPVGRKKVRRRRASSDKDDQANKDNA